MLHCAPEGVGVGVGVGGIGVGVGVGWRGAVGGGFRGWGRVGFGVGGCWIGGGEEEGGVRGVGGAGERWEGECGRRLEEGWWGGSLAGGFGFGRWCLGGGASGFAGWRGGRHGVEVYGDLVGLRGTELITA